jgi:hypothetical protein
LFYHVFDCSPARHVVLFACAQGVVDGEGTELASGGDLTADISGDMLDHVE